MKREAVISLCTVSLSLAFFLPESMQAKSAGSADDLGAAAHMVAAQATLLKPIDARKTQSGQEFQAALTDEVHLKGGPELPKGTVLVGTVVTDQMHQAGPSKFALRFTEAERKDGKVIPIKATIISLYKPDSPDSEDPMQWTPHIHRIDQIGALSGVDLHSDINGSNSGVFVSAKKHDLKLWEGSGLALAIEALPNARTNAIEPNGGA
jgi:hypothetical protein